MEAGQKLFIGAASALVLCIGLSLLLFQTRIVSDLFDTVRDQMKDKELYQQYYSEDIEEVSYAELVATLCNDLEYDIVIDGNLIKRNVHDIDMISEYHLREGDYRKQYQYDEGGTIILITYTSNE